MAGFFILNTKNTKTTPSPSTKHLENLYGTGNIGKIEVKYSWVPKRSSGGNPTEGSSSAGNPGEGLPQELVLSRTDAVYYYVHDYLGSIAATLDNRGEFVFAEQVYPYGEVKQKYEAGTATQQRFDFTGKERDAETGLHYYGARYYDSKLGIWLSVDPLLDKYPGVSPYNYCLNNPINAVDPDGRELVRIKEGNMTIIVDKKIADNARNFIREVQVAKLPLRVNNSFRTTKEQAKLYKEKMTTGNNPNPVAKPGRSRHESGFAIDFSGVRNLNTAQREQLNTIANANGFATIKNDPPHFEADSKPFYENRSNAISENQIDYQQKNGDIPIEEESSEQESETKNIIFHLVDTIVEQDATKTRSKNEID